MLPAQTRESNLTLIQTWLTDKEMFNETTKAFVEEFLQEYIIPFSETHVNDFLTADSLKKIEIDDEFGFIDVYYTRQDGCVDYIWVKLAVFLSDDPIFTKKKIELEQTIEATKNRIIDAQRRLAQEIELVESAQKELAELVAQNV